MPLKLEIKKLLSARTDRVKSVDFHPTEPWVLAGLYSGTVMIWDYTTQALVRQMEVSNLPIRCARFVLRRQWVIAGCDDMTVKVLNYNTLEKIKSLDGHTDYIRYIAVHPSLPLVLTSSDDMSIKLWDWEKGWSCVSTFEGHSHYVMMVQWNPKENTTFASASLDRSIKIWGVSGGSSAHFTLSGHQRGVNCLDYASSGDKPYLVSGSDDKTVRVWDYQTKQCVHVLEGHTGNVSSVAFHPTLPLIVSGSEDGVCKLWHATTYRLESSLNYMLDRLWSISTLKGSNAIALGYDEGTVVVKLGSDEPVVSFCQGKLIWAKGVDIQTVNLKALARESVQDGEPVANLPVKDMGACELFPQLVSHHPSGRMFAVCGDGEYVIYTAQALRNKSFGHALGFAWSPEGHYATRCDGGNKITVFHNYKEAFSFKVDFQVDDICSGELLGVRGPDFVLFYDWTEYRVVRRIDVTASTDVFWSETGKFVAIPTTDTLFVLAFDRESVVAACAGGADPEEGVEIAFELHNEVQESGVKSGVWVSDNCFAFVNDKLKLNTLVGGMVEVVAHLDNPVKILGYLSEHQKIYCCDKTLNVIAFDLDLNLVRYKSAISCNDIATAESLFSLIPASRHTAVARFLEAQGYRAEALEITKDAEHKFELALSIGKLSLASQLVNEFEGSSVVSKRKMVGDKAIEIGDLALAESSFLAANDAPSLLLLASCSGDEKLLVKVAEIARSEGTLDVELMARTLLGDAKGCTEALLQANMTAEAVLYARAHCPWLLKEIVPKWKEEIAQINPQLAKAVGDPQLNPELFNLPLDDATSHVPIKLASEVQGGPPPLGSSAKLPSINQPPSLGSSLQKAPEVQAPPPYVGSSPVVRQQQHPEIEHAPVVSIPPRSIEKSIPPPPSIPEVTRTLPTPPTSARTLPTPPAMPPRSAAFRGPPPLPGRSGIPSPPGSARGPEVQVLNPSPESQQPVPRAPESTNEDMDLL